MIAEADTSALDIADCDREPIHIPGSIQPHGVLLVLDHGLDRILAASASTERHLGRPAQELAGQPPSQVLQADDVRAIGQMLDQLSGAGLDAVPVRIGQGLPWLAIAPRHDGLAFIELEPPAPAGEAAGSVLLRLAAATRTLQETASHADACQGAAEAIRAITGFDRVMVYRFAQDWSGEVLGESRDADWDSYLGLHFPASDIPAQARALYLANPIRLIATASYTPSPLVPDRLQGGRPIDLSFATLRSVSPVHLEYLRNMGAAASMSVSVVRDGVLWGLVACHHRTPHRVGFAARQACDLVAGILSGQLATLDRVEAAAWSGRVTALHARLLEEAASGHGVADALIRQAPSLLRLAEATGFALLTPAGIRQAGHVPPDQLVLDLATGIELPGRDGVFHTDRLAALSPAMAAEAWRASGVLAVPLSPGSLMMWFRSEQARLVTWAGAPGKAVVREAGHARLHPRRSFESWTEEVRGRSTPWTAAHVGAALQLRALVLEMSARERDVLERQNLTLARSNRDLETFIYVASHDIKEPLRQMEMLTSLLGGCVRPDASADAREFLDEFAVLSGRLRRLTDELAEYARPNRADTAMSPLDLGEVAGGVLTQLRQRIAEAGAVVTLGTLPLVLGERTQLHQVFMNLVGNALKYREPSRKLHVSIGEVAGQSPDAWQDLPMVHIAVEDNGIGFEPKYGDRVFDAFMRLHSRDQYEGSGLGLAICRRVIERHGGRIEATGNPGHGAVFTFSLPSALSAPRL